MKKADRTLLGAVAALGALVLFLSTAGYVFPGESAHLLALWHGVDVISAASAPYPLTAALAWLFGGGNLIAPFAGLATLCLLTFLVLVALPRLMDGEDESDHAVTAARLTAAVAAAVLLFTPAFRSAASHLEPALVEFAWALAALALLAVWVRLEGALASAVLALAGAMWGAVAADGALGLCLLPLAFAALAVTAWRTGRRVFSNLLLFFGVGLVAFFVVLGATGGVGAGIDRLGEALGALFGRRGWLMAAAFSVFPFLVMTVMVLKTHIVKDDFARIVFYIAMTLVSVLSLATPLSAGELMERHGVLPVAASAFAALTAALLIAQLWTLVRVAQGAIRLQAVAGTLLGVLALVAAVTSAFSLLEFSPSAGAFADRVAETVLDDLDTRDWLVTDGRLDDHLRLAAARRGRPLRLVNLTRDGDAAYLDRLEAAIVAELPDGAVLRRSLRDIGLIAFVQDWFAGDTNIAARAAVFGAPDLWLAGELKPMPEFAFFGGDPARQPDWSRWAELDDVLAAEPDWGSYRMGEVENPVERLRLELRRHFGLVANDRGVWLEDAGRGDEASAAYELTLDRIDPDNIAALFNAYSLACRDNPKAALRKFEFERRLKAIVDDPKRRYVLTALANYYGYIRDPAILVRLGCAWARSGLPGEALNQMRRAMDFVAADRQGPLLNYIAALQTGEDRGERSRELYNRVLEIAPEDHDALIGLMRIALAGGDTEMAKGYLKRALDAAGDDPRVLTERALLQVLEGDLPAARKLLNAATDADEENLEAWALKATVVMRQCDEATDPAVREELTRELEKGILPMMAKETDDPNDYHLQTVRAFVAMRKGNEGLQDARDAFAVAAHSRPEIAATLNTLMELDIALNDRESALAHAREALCRNRNSPLGNYILGSTALVSNDFAAAEHYLRKAADGNGALPAAMSDLAETYRRLKRYDEALAYARKAVTAQSDLYVAYDIIASVLVEKRGDAAEAREAIERAIAIATVDGRLQDVRLMMTLARVQILGGDRRMAGATVRKVKARAEELSEYERRELAALERELR